MWFSASLFFRAIRPDGAVELCEEQIVLVSATDERDARMKAERIGVQKQHGYDTAAGVHLEWTFYRVERIYQLEVDVTAFRDGFEIFSRFLRESEVESLLTPFED
jgi:Domain of unknown function (DUF4288)